MSDLNDLDEILRKCDSCKALVKFDPLFVHERYDEYGEDEEYTFAECPNCSEPALFFRHELKLQRDILEISEPVFHVLWPVSERVINYSLPKTIAQSYEEACQAEFNNLPNSAAIMIGRVLESICQDFSFKARTLAGSLQKMKDEGILSEELFTWGNELRLIRNKAAHVADTELELSEVSDALDFLQSLLELLYKTRPKFQRFRERNNHS